MIPAAGLGLLILVALGIVFTGLPAFVILIAAATIGAALGVLTDTVPLSLLTRRPSAPLVSGMALGALLGPMNGSVGASVLALSRVVAPRLAESGVPKPTQFAAVAVASTADRKSV